MGDTGSLALGGALGAIAVVAHHEIVLGIIGGLFVVEALSVIIQVFFFKRTGKRVFRMAPIHHHFEQLGWSRADRRDPLLDHRVRAGAGRARDVEAAVIVSRSLARASATRCSGWRARALATVERAGWRAAPSVVGVGRAIPPRGERVGRRSTGV